MNYAWEEGLSYIKLECPQGVVAIPTAVIILDKHSCTDQDCQDSARCQTRYNVGIILHWWGLLLRHVSLNCLNLSEHETYVSEPFVLSCPVKDCNKKPIVQWFKEDGREFKLLIDVTTRWESDNKHSLKVPLMPKEDEGK